MLTLLFLGAVLVLTVVAQSQVDITMCTGGEPPILSVTYNFDFSGGTVCANTLRPLVFSPTDGTENDSYTVTRITGPSFRVCVFNNNTDLSVTGLNGNGTFNVTFVSQGRSVTLPVSYGAVPQGFYNEVQEQTLPSTMPIWQAIAIRNFVSISVCQFNGTSLVNISFLEANAERIETCLNGAGDIDPFYVTLSLKENASNVVTNQPLLVHVVNGSCDNPGIRSDPAVTITILDAMTTITTPTPTPTLDPSPTVTASPTVPGGISGGSIAGIVIGSVVIGVVLLILVLLSLWFGIPHLKESRGKINSRRTSRVLSEEEGDPSIDDKTVVERPPEPEVRLEPVQNTQAQQEQRSTPPPLSQPSDKFMVVMSLFPELADELSKKHELRLHPLKEARVINGYNQRVYSAMKDSDCEVMYFIWGHNMEEASKVTDPPVSDIVRELVARPLPATDLKKVVFVQLGSKSAVPLSTMIHQVSLEECPSDGHFNVHECANSIYEKARNLLRSDELLSSDDVDAVKGATRRITRIGSNEATPTEPLPPQNITPPPSPPPPSYNTATNTGGLESRSMPAIGQSRVVAELQTAESASVGNSPQTERIMKAQLVVQEELVREVRELRKTIGDNAEKHSNKVVAAIQGDRGTTTKQLDAINTNLEAVGDTVHSLQDTVVTMDHKLEEVKGEVSIVKERTEKLQDTVEGVGAHVEELGDDVQDLRERFDEATLEQELPRENQKS